MFLVIANWKMNGDIALTAEFNLGVKPREAEVVICAPFHLISSLNGRFTRGAQDCHWAEKGAFTGEISGHMLSSLGVEYVILGHSERREAGETCDIVAKKAAAAQKAGLCAIICIGEKDGEDMETIIRQQLKNSLPENTDEVIIAYEPVWAIGTGKVPTAAQIKKAHALITQISGLDVIYGGSVKPENAEEISDIEGVSGLLVGGAGLDVTSLNEIIEVI